MGFSSWLQDASPGVILVTLGLPLVGVAWVVGALEEEPEEEPVAVEAPDPTTEETQQAPAPDSPEPAGPDILSEAACEHFRNVAGDIAAGLLTVEEIRAKMIEVRESGRFSEDPGIAEASTALVATVTQDDADGFIEAVGQMDDACADVGL